MGVGKEKFEDSLEADSGGEGDAGDGADGLHDIGGEGVVELYDGEGVAFGFVAAKGEVGDVLVGVSEDGADGTDDAGAVVVTDDKEVALDGGIDEETVDFDDAWAAADDGSGDAEFFIAFAEFGDEEVVEFGLGADGGFGEV